MECCRRATPEDKENKRIEAEIKKDKKSDCKSVLLLGPGESGKSTLFKQMKIIQFYDAGYTLEELKLFIPMIRWNAVTQMQQLLTAGLRLQILEGSLAERAKTFTQIPDSSWSMDVARTIKNFWEDASVQRIYALRDAEFHLNETAHYFFEHIMRLAEENYIPTEADILRARTRTTGIEEAKFAFDDLTLKVTDVGGQRGERRKWIHCFTEVDAILYVAALSEYDQVLLEDSTKNRMKESLELFRNICESRHLKDVPIIIFLNKEDLFDKKIQTSPLNKAFPNYEGGNDAKKGKEYILARYLELLSIRQSKEYFYHFTCAIDTSNIKKIFADVKGILLNKTIGEIGLGTVLSAVTEHKSLKHTYLIMSVFTKRGPMTLMVIGAMVFGTIGYKWQLSIEEKLRERTKRQYLKIAEEIEEEERQKLGLTTVPQKVATEEVLDSIDKKLTGRK